MLRKFLLAKIHKATVTGAKLMYMGSIEIDVDLLKASGLKNGEYVEIYNITNGERFSTYIIEGKAGSGSIVLNGAAARKVQKGDQIIITGYAYLNDSEIEKHKYTVVFVDDKNKIIDIKKG